MLNSKNKIIIERIQWQAVKTARSPYGLWGLGFISFIESALMVPIITDPFLVAYIIAHKKKAIVGVVFTTLASVLGGITAYVFAVGFFDMMAPFLSTGHIEQVYSFAERFQEGTFILTLLGAITPVPYTLVALAAGFVHGNFILFVLATVIGRGLRYVLVGYLTYYFGERGMVLIKKNLFWTSIILFAAVATYILIKML